MTDPNRISVILPTYNRAQYIERALTSLLNQTRVPDEIIVIDDGSRDETRSILSGYENRITVISNERNYGPSVARNRGLNVASGDFLAFLDSDDTLPADSIELRIRALLAYPEYDIVYGDAQFIAPDGCVLNRFSEFRPHERPSGDVYFQFMRNNLAPIHTFMIRRTPKTSTLRMDTTLKTLEDYEFWLKLSEVSSFLYLDDVLANYHIHDSMTTTLESKAMRSNRIVVQMRSIERPRFHQLNQNQQMLIYTQLGASIATVQGDMVSARMMLGRALRLNRFHWPALFYWLMTWSGRRGIDALNQLRRAILSRRPNSQFPTTGTT